MELTNETLTVISEIFKNVSGLSNLNVVREKRLEEILLSPKKVAEVSKIPESRIRYLIHNDPTFPFMKTGKRYFINIELFENWSKEKCKR